MRARGFNKKIELWQTVSVQNEFGGSQVLNQKIGNSWAKIETIKATASKLNEVGLNDMSLNLKITVRYRNDIQYTGENQFIICQGTAYYFVMSPNEAFLNRTFVTLIASRSKSDSIKKYAAININGALDNELNTQL